MIISNILENTNDGQCITQDDFLQFIDEKMKLVQSEFEKDFILAERNFFAEIVNTNEKVNFGNLSENVEEYELIQEGVINNFIKNVKDAIISLCKKIKEIFESIFKGITSKRNETFKLVKLHAKSNPVYVERKVELVDIEQSLRDIHIEQAQPILTQVMDEYHNDIRIALDSVSIQDQIDKTIGDSFNDTLNDLKNRLGFKDIPTLSANNIDDKISNYNCISLRVSSDSINSAEKDFFMYENRVGTRIEKLKENTINVLSGFMCKKLDELPKNKEILNTIQNNVDITNAKGVEQYVLTATANLVSQMSVIINNITNTYLKVYSQNIVGFMNTVRTLVE